MDRVRHSDHFSPLPVTAASSTCASYVSCPLPMVAPTSASIPRGVTNPQPEVAFEPTEFRAVSLDRCNKPLQIAS
ncbi:hypothetical protein F2Q68_00031941 [Brassica cretica]|uniref:Uncharacterized protein n=1 Tax=Brassica cretica TaxID=69181 RepID=A0A8S9G6N5_BRACR|nr:hypothetical protein F2Q68_00031941 [Brassica cretica]